MANCSITRGPIFSFQSFQVFFEFTADIFAQCSPTGFQAEHGPLFSAPACPLGGEEVTWQARAGVPD